MITQNALMSNLDIVVELVVSASLHALEHAALVGTSDVARSDFGLNSARSVRHEDVSMGVALPVLPYATVRIEETYGNFDICTGILIVNDGSGFHTLLFHISQNAGITYIGVIGS